MAPTEAAGAASVAPRAAGAPRAAAPGVAEPWLHWRTAGVAGFLVAIGALPLALLAL